MIKKIIGVLCAIAVSVSSLSIVFAEDPVATITAGSVSVEQGTENAVVEVPITFSGVVKLSSFQVKVSFSEGVTVSEFVTGDVLQLIPPQQSSLGKKDVVLGWFDDTGEGKDTKNGTLVTLKVSVPVNNVADYEVDVIVQEIYDAYDNDITLDVKAFDSKISVVGAQTPVDEPDEPVEEVMTSTERKQDVICLQVGKNLTVTYGAKKSIDENPLVVPYINNDRTLVPLRFISEALSAEVLWEEGWDGCIIKKGEKEIKFTFGSAEFTVNGVKYTYEAPIEMVHDRTMVPVRFISEHLDCDVYWEPINGAVIIAPMDNPWVPERKSEIRATNEMLISILNII